MLKSDLHRRQEMKECIQNCLDCSRFCLETAAYCRHENEKTPAALLAPILEDCAEICAMNAGLLARDSDFYMLVGLLCANVCSVCADACELHAVNDPKIDRCVKICRLTAESCAAIVYREPGLNLGLLG